jgi:hypothetical protein
VSAPAATAPAATAAAEELARRIAFVEGLRAAKEGAQARPLAEVVKGHLEHLWETGGRAGATKPGRRPERIFIRPQFIVGPPDAEPGPVLPRLVQGKGLQLRLELLMLFEAQCRHEPGAAVRTVRRVTPHGDEKYTSWRELVLAANTVTAGTGRGPGDLRARAINEAMRALEAQHLLEIPTMKGGVRRQYDQMRLWAESSTAEASARYTVPEAGVFLPRQFFTNLWLFALTDTELATYLTLAFLRHRFPTRHATEGVHLTDAARRASFKLTRTAWRSTDLLHRFRLIDRQHDGVRSFRTGKIGNIAERWRNNEVTPVKFKLDDAVLDRPALDVIHQVLTAPTAEDHLRRDGLRVEILTLPALPGA